MKRGKVKFFNEAKGFGFIKSDDGQDIFVHASEVTQPIRENDDVEFEVKSTTKGLNAVKVKLV